MTDKNYIIDERIIFSPSTESLHIIEYPDISVTLTPACSRLLTYIIDNKNKVLTRDNIFKEIWEQYGSTPSNSSLNTYISLIRKGYFNLRDEGELIITIPKTGFLFNPQISVEIQHSDSSNLSLDSSDDMTHYHDDIEQVQYAGDEHYGHSPDINPKLNLKQKNIIRNFMLTKPKGFVSGSVTFVSFIFLIVMILAIFSHNRNEQRKIHPVKIEQINECSVFFLPLDGGDALSFQENDIKNMINKSGFKCRKNGIYYIFADKMYTSSQKGKTFISYCEVHNKYLKSCQDFVGVSIESS